MAFEHKLYPDGDAVFELPMWRKTIESIQANLEPVSYETSEKQNRSFQEDEVGLKHPISASKTTAR